VDRAVDGAPPHTFARAEAAIAAVLFVFGVGVFGVREWRTASTTPAIAALLLFALLTGTTMSLSVAKWRERLHASVSPWPLRLFLAPLAIAAAIVLYSVVTGLAVIPRALAFSAYLILPAAILGLPHGTPPSPVRMLAAAVTLWLPIEFDVLPSLPLPPPGGFRGAPLAALANGLYLCLVACPVDRIGYTFRLRRRDVTLALLATGVYAVVGVPLGLGTHFLQWHPRIDLASAVVVPLAIYLVTAVPEEFLFRGLIQNGLQRSFGRAALPVAAVIFGFAHLPDLRYVVLATLAGLAYGWVYARTGRITASAITHALVDWIWVFLLRS
jgi:membrane protease YdiL (CAAX protease family)